VSVYDYSVFERPMSGEELLAEYQHTWPRHNGYVRQAAEVLGIEPRALARRFYRMRKQGMWVEFIDDTKALRR